MKTFEQILKDAGLEDEAVQSVLSDMKENKVYTASQENLDIRYEKLKKNHEATVAELETANNTLDSLKGTAEASEEMKRQIADYEAKVQELNAAKVKAETDSALKVALMEAGAKDIDYITYKFGEVKLDENGKVVDFDKTIETLKAEHPDQFKVEKPKQIDPNPLPGGKGNPPSVTKEEFKKMGYAQRSKLQREDPETYEALTKE